MKATKRFKLTFGILSAGYILLGLVLMLAPTSSQVVICTMLGIVSIILGIIRIAYFLMKGDQHTRAFQNDLGVGVMLVMAGIYIIARHAFIWNMLPVIMGFAIVYDCIIKLQYALDLRRIKYALWWIFLVVSLAICVLGVLLVLGLFSGDFGHYYFAIVLIIDGIAGLVTIGHMLMVKRQMHRSQNGKTSLWERHKAKKAQKALNAAADIEVSAEDMIPAPDANGPLEED